MSSEVTDWRIRHFSGPAGAFHERMPTEDTGPEIWVHTVPRPALVLGSTQPDDLVHRHLATADGIEVCRRRSGGGLVWVDPSTDCWIDVIVPANSPRWQADVGVAFHWLGQVWVDALRRALPAGASAGSDTGCEPIVHRSSGRSPAGKVWCFTDLGHGEVSIDGSKVVGLSQRRTRTWARLQCLVLGAWPAETVERYVNLNRAVELVPDVAKSELAADAVTAGFPPGCLAPDPSRLAAEFLAALTEK